jgi:nicotinate-nucleotide adenylyltransferase
LQKVGLFGGTFDPIHFGHLNLALSLLEQANLDRVIFCPAHTSPLKNGEPPRASKEDRLAMVSLAIAEIPQFSLLDFEVQRPPPSYTIDTVRFLLSKEKVELRLILGEDSLQQLAKWKEVDELLRLAPPLVGTRLSLPGILPVQPVKIPVMEISSTEIRARLRRDQFCGHLVPKDVLTLIKQKNLYT